jgi:hypothetical protein
MSSGLLAMAALLLQQQLNLSPSHLPIAFHHHFCHEAVMVGTTAAVQHPEQHIIGHKSWPPVDIGCQVSLAPTQQVLFARRKGWACRKALTQHACGPRQHAHHEAVQGRAVEASSTVTPCREMTEAAMQPAVVTDTHAV